MAVISTRARAHVHGAARCAPRSARCCVPKANSIHSRRRVLDTLTAYQSQGVLLLALLLRP
jgi:hypothetical protein